MHNDVRLLRDAAPVLVAHAELVALEVTNDDLEPALLDPLVVPRPAALSTLPQARKRLVGRPGAHVADDLGDLAAAALAVEEVAQDEGAEETGRAREEDRLGLVRRGGLVVRRAERPGEGLGVVGVLVIGSGGGLSACRGLLAARCEAEVGVTERVELLCEGADGREVKDEAEWRARGERAAQLKDEARREDRVPAEVEEALVERDLGRRRGEELEPDVVDRLLGRRELLSVGTAGRGRRRAGRDERGGGGDRVGEGERGLVDLAVGVERHARERDDDCVSGQRSVSLLSGTTEDRRDAPEGTE